MSTIRQGQGPFSGQVPPAGDALFFQEEFQSGDNAVPFSPLAGPGTQPMPLRWVEWTLTGLPFALGTCAVIFVGITGALQAVVDAALIFDWAPIPPLAAALLSDVPALVEYR